MQDRPDDRLPPEGEAAARRGEGLIADLARKAVAGSVGAILSSEEGIKQIIGAIVPKEVGQYVARELAVLRAEALKAVVGEVSRFLERVEPAEELKKVLDGLTFDVHLSMNVRRTDRATGAPEPEPVPLPVPAPDPDPAPVEPVPESQPVPPPPPRRRARKGPH